MIYVATERDYSAAIKIGHTETKGLGVSKKSALVRLGGLQVGTWRELVLIAMLPGSRPDEQDLHRRFRAHWIRGEWFANVGPVAEWLASLPESETRGPSPRAPTMRCANCNTDEHTTAGCELLARRDEQRRLRSLSSLARHGEEVELLRLEIRRLKKEIGNRDRAMVAMKRDQERSATIAVHAIKRALKQETVTALSQGEMSMPASNENERPSRIVRELDEIARVSRRIKQAREQRIRERKPDRIVRLTDDDPPVQRRESWATGRPS
jgi:hypothetical protein